MANNIAFQPMGKTYLLAANSTSQSINVSADSPVQQYRLTNHDTTNAAFVRITTGASNAFVPNAAGTYGFPVRYNDDIVITAAQCSPNVNVVISFITASGTANVFVTPGEGL